MTPDDALPDAEAALAALVERMRGAVAHDAAFVGIYSGGAWVAERLAALLPGEHRVGFIDVSYYRDDYEISGLKANAKRTARGSQLGRRQRGARAGRVEATLQRRALLGERLLGLP